MLIACLQPACVHVVSLSAGRCWGVRYAADVLTLMTLFAWAGSKSSCLDVNWPPRALSFLYHFESVKKCLLPCPGIVPLRWTATFESCLCILKMSQAYLQSSIAWYLGYQRCKNCFAVAFINAAALLSSFIGSSKWKYFAFSWHLTSDLLCCLQWTASLSSLTKPKLFSFGEKNLLTEAYFDLVFA